MQLWQNPRTTVRSTLYADVESNTSAVQGVPLVLSMYTECKTSLKCCTSPSMSQENKTWLQLDFHLTFYLLYHFLQPNVKNTQHKLKISHLIVHNVLIFYHFTLSVWHSHSPWSHGTRIQFNMSKFDRVGGVDKTKNNLIPQKQISHNRRGGIVRKSWTNVF